MLNSNIRCIEMEKCLTSSVLKRLLNSNIRCIEMLAIYNGDVTAAELNSNIRCIEIPLAAIFFYALKG